MAIINVIKHEFKDGNVCFKFPIEDLKLGSQLIVYPSQTAFFVKGGTICDEFTSGTHTLKSDNLPLLNKIINLPFGSESPFSADIWFVNQVAKLNIEWGTPKPIQVEDPKYKIIVPVRAHGQYGIRICNPRLFIETLIGNMSSFSINDIESYFKGRIISFLNNIIAQQIIQHKTSVLDINTKLIDLSSNCEDNLNSYVSKYGISITEFTIMSISFPENDESVIKLKSAKDTAARLTITGKDVYQMERSFDVLEKAASNEGAGGQMLGMGVGMGAGIGAGKVMYDSSKILNTNPLTPPPLPSQEEKTYYLVINGTQIGNQTFNQIKTFIQQGIVTGETLVWTDGMENWGKLIDVAPLNTLLQSKKTSLPPPIPNL